MKIDYVNSQTVWYYDDETVITTLEYNSFNNIIKGDVIYRTKVSAQTGDEDSASTINCSFLNDLSQLKITAGKDTYKTEFQGTEYTFESSYDEDERVQNKAIKNAAESIVDYEYKYDSSGRVESYSVNTENFSNEYGYEYDDKGNITSYGSWVNGKVNPQECTTYHYDSKSQLVRVDENRHRSNGTRITDGTQVIEYDSRGNLKAVKNYSYSTDDSLKNNNPDENLELKYSYEDNVWLDEIEYSKGSEKQYVYDENGNPISIEDLNFHWTNGRQLESLSYMDENGEEQTIVSYKYDDNGIRVSKTIGDETTYYVYANGNILAQYKLDENNSPMEFMEFLYDDTGSITGFSYEGKTYFYVKNPQGDITNIVDLNGVNLINYYYYSYGESAFDIDESAYDYGYTRDDMDTVLSNPITYRGYYRDEETAFYYLQSRYYIPSGGRFLNADIPLYAQLQKDITAGLNLFAYCNNDPVNYVDENGFSAVVAGSAFTYYFVNYVLPNIFIYGIATTTGILFAYLLIKAVSDSISNSGSSGSSKSPKKPKNNPKIQKILKRIPNSLKNGDKVDLSKFNSPVKGKTAWKSSNGWTIEKDTAKHGGRVWKLFDKAGKRIASLGADGSVLAK